MNAEAGAYLTVYGRAEVVRNTSKMERLWVKELESWFDGHQDPSLVLLKVGIRSANLWDVGENRLLHMIKGDEVFPDSE